MANLQNRTRVMYVRISEDEFRKFSALCQTHGARNMSDLVRAAMDGMARQRGTEFEQEVTHRLQKLESSLDHLRKNMELITMGKTA